MQRTLMLTTILLLTTFAIAQEADLDPPEATRPIESTWALQLGDDTPNGLGAIRVAEDGSVYISGSTQGTLVDGQAIVGKDDAYLAKLTAEGQVAWIKQFGTESFDWATDLWIQDDRLYVAGSTGASLFGDHVGHHAQCTCELPNMWIAVYDLDGNELWSAQFGLPSNMGTDGIVVDSGGNVYVTGWASDDLPDDRSKGEIDIFILKYDPEGQFVWGHYYGGPERDVPSELIIGPDDTVYVTGQTLSTIDMPVAEGDGGDLLIVAVDADGEQLWARQYGSSGYDWPYGVAIDSETGDLFVTGYSSRDFAGEYLGGGNDGFLLALDADGNWLWADPVATPKWEQTMGVTVADDGTVIAAGLGDQPIGDSTTGAAGMFLVGYSPDGVRQWAIQYKDTPISIVPEKLVTGPDGAIYAGASTMSSIARERTGNDNDILILRFDPPAEENTDTDDAGTRDDETSEE